jgi:hypothetical protein
VCLSSFFHSFNTFHQRFRDGRGILTDVAIHAVNRIGSGKILAVVEGNAAFQLKGEFRCVGVDVPRLRQLWAYR